MYSPDSTEYAPWTFTSQTSCTTSTLAYSNIWWNGWKDSWDSITGSSRSTMLGKKLLFTPDSAYGKRPITKSHNGKERRCAILAVVFQLYWRPHCEIRTVLSIRMSSALWSVLACWWTLLSWLNIAVIHQTHFPKWKATWRHSSGQRTFFLSCVPRRLPVLKQIARIQT